MTYEQFLRSLTREQRRYYYNEMLELALNNDYNDIKHYAFMCQTMDEE